LTTTGHKVSDEQIKEWLLELVEGEEHVYGYKLLAQCLRNEHGLILGKIKLTVCVKNSVFCKSSVKGSPNIHADFS
jgi:hypothetical protein